MNYIFTFVIAYTIYHWPAWMQFIFNLIFMLTISLLYSHGKHKHRHKKVFMKLIKRLSKGKFSKKKR